MDDLCLVHISGSSLGVAQTSRLGEELIEFIAQRKCRKLLISFDEVGGLYDFLIENPANLRSQVKAGRGHPVSAHATAGVGSDHWLG